MNTEHERIKFEAACHRHAEEAGHEGAAKLERDGDGYADPATQAAWWGWREGRAALQSQATEAFPCRIVEADFEAGTVTLEMQGDYTVSSGQKYLCDAPLQSQDREDAEWMKCESRRPWVTNSLKHRAQELRAAEKRSRRAFNKDYMSEPARYFADACGEAAAVFEAKLIAIDHARRVEGGGE